MQKTEFTSTSRHALRQRIYSEKTRFLCGILFFTLFKRFDYILKSFGRYLEFKRCAHTANLRYADGVIPVCCLNILVKYATLSKPSESEISLRDILFSTFYRFISFVFTSISRPIYTHFILLIGLQLHLSLVLFLHIYL